MKKKKQLKTVYGEGVTLKEQGKLECALKKLTEAARSGREDAELRSELADTYRQLGRYGRSEREYRKAIQLAGGNDGFLFQGLGRTYKQWGKYRKALDSFSKAACRGVDGPQAAYDRADTWRLAGEFGKSEEEYLEALKNYPGDRTLNLELGRLYKDQGRFESALNYLRAAIGSENADRNLRGEIEEVENNMGKPEETITRETPPVQEKETEKNMENRKEGKKETEETGEINFMRARSYLKEFRLEPAEKEIRRALRKGREGADIRTQLGFIHRMKKDLRAAETEYGKALEADQEYAEARIGMAAVYREMGMRETAEEEFRWCMDRVEGMNPLLKADLYENYGFFLLDKEDMTGGKELFEKCLECNPLKLQVSQELAQIYNYLGLYEKAFGLCSRYEDSGMNRCGSNRLLNEGEIAGKKTVLESRPRILLMTLTNRCNLSCPMCGIGENKWDISDNLCNEILNLMPYLELATWQGGEVFLYPRFREILNKSQECTDLRQIIITNGLLIDPSWAEELVLCGSADLTVSIDGMTANTYENMRKGADFNRLKENLRVINRMKNKYGSTMSMSLRFTVSPDNYHELSRTVDFAYKYGFRSLILFPLDGYCSEGASKNMFDDPGTAGELLELRRETARKAARKKINLIDNLPGSTEEKPVERNRKEKKDRKSPSPSDILPCHRPWKELAVRVNGDMFPECLCVQPAGNIFENTLEEVWNSEEMINYRKKMIEGDFSGCGPLCREGCISEYHRKMK